MEPMELAVRQYACALPQPGWGGTTLAGYIEAIGLRPDASGSDVEIAEVLDRLVAGGVAQPAGPATIDDPDFTVEAGDEPRWELTEDAHDALVAPVPLAEGGTPATVMLALEPGVTTSAANSEVK